MTQIPYEDGVHMTQYFVHDGEGWYLIGYDGVARDISDDGEIAEVFAQLA
jgi:hypothetical protein